MEAATGAELQSVVRLPYDPGPNFDGIPTPWDMGISNMSLNANNGLVPQYEPGFPNYPVESAVIYDVDPIAGLILQGVTIDATTDDPANPTLPSGPVVFDVMLNTDCSNVQFLDSTLVGPGVSMVLSNSTSFNNCHFIGCGPTNAQISIGAAGRYLDLSVTRCTDQSLVDNITSPGGNVELDGAARLMWGDGIGGDLYVGSSAASDMYTSPPDTGNGLNGGQIIELEPQAAFENQNITIYQNKFACDGAEAFLDNGGGVLVAGTNVIVAGNDLSNGTTGISTWYPPNTGIVESFDMYVDNSIHNVYDGISFIGSSSSSQTPIVVGNSFNGNLINGIRSDFNVWGNNPTTGTLSTAISISPFLQSTQPPQMLENIFYDDIVTGTPRGFIWEAGTPTVQNGPIVLTNCFFSSDGSVSSTLANLYSAFDDPLIDPTLSSQDFWNSLSFF
jgi:hypothetical protein